MTDNRAAAKRYRERHPYRLREAEKRYLDEHPEARERKRNRNKTFSEQYRNSNDGKAKRQAYMREYYRRPEVREREKLRSLQRREYQRAYARARHLQITYGMSEAEFELLAEAQGGVCAICRSRRVRVVDHDHSTGQRRGLLCHHCNMALGLMEDRAGWLIAAAEYLSARKS